MTGAAMDGIGAGGHASAPGEAGAGAEGLRARQLALRDAVTAATLDAGSPAPAESAALAALLGPGAQRLGIYRNAYAGRLVAALRENFPVLAQVLGDEGFDALAAAYLAEWPSSRPSIRWFGHALAEFMAVAPDELVPHPAMVDIARMEWALRDAFDAPDAPALAVETLAALPPEQWPALRFVAHPSACCLALDWAVEPAWRVLQSAAEAAEAPQLPPPQAHPHALLVWRSGLETRWRSLDEDEAGLWRALAAGECFADLCARAAEGHGEQAAAGVVAGALRQWVGDGLLAGG